MTPVEATTIWVGRTLSSVAACRAVARVSRIPRSPVQALAQPELTTTAVMPSPSKSRCEPLTSSGAALISLVVMTCAQTCGPPKAMSARSLFRFLMPAWTPAILIPGTAPSPPRTAISRTASTDGNAASDKSAFLRESEHNIHILHGLTGSTFTEIIQSADDVNDSAALRDRELRVVGH